MIKKRLSLLRLLSTPNLFLILATIFGTYFILNVPLLWGSDETFHTMRIYQLSEGNLRAQHLGDTRELGGYGGDVPENLVKLTQYVNYDLQNNATTSTIFGTKNVNDPSIYKELGNKKLDDGKYTSYAFSNTAAYSPVPYLPSLVGMWIAQGLDLSVSQSIKLMRAFSLVAYVVVIYVALKILKKSNYKWIIFSIALLPTTLFQASIISADSLTNAILILYSAILLKALVIPKYKLKILEIILLGFSIISIPLLKPGYLPLILLVFLIPNNRFIAKNSAISFKFTLMASSFFLAALWSLATKSVAQTIKLIKPGEDWQDIDTHGQIIYIIHQPVAYIENIARTLLLNDNNYIGDIVGSLGFNAVKVPGIVFILEIVILVTAILLTENVVIKKRVPYTIIASVFGCFLLTVTILYISYSSVGSPVVSGIQGRYFLPLIPLLLGAIALIIPTQHFGLKQHSAKIVLCSMVIFCLFASAFRYHYVTWG